MTHTTRRPPAIRWLPARLLAAWLVAGCLLTHAGARPRILDRLAAETARRWRRLRAAPDEGLATVEVAILAAVLLGLATALLAVITAVVNKHMSQIK
jgi:hypothetical protein